MTRMKSNGKVKANLWQSVMRSPSMWMHTDPMVGLRAILKNLAVHMVRQDHQK